MALGTTDFEYVLVASLIKRSYSSGAPFFKQTPDLYVGAVKDWSTTLAGFSVASILDPL